MVFDVGIQVGIDPIEGCVTAAFEVIVFDGLAERFEVIVAPCAESGGAIDPVVVFWNLCHGVLNSELLARVQVRNHYLPRFVPSHVPRYWFGCQ